MTRMTSMTRRARMTRMTRMTRRARTDTAKHRTIYEKYFYDIFMLIFQEKALILQDNKRNRLFLIIHIYDN